MNHEPFDADMADDDVSFDSPDMHRKPTKRTSTPDPEPLDAELDAAHKMADDDASLDLPATPRRKLKPVAVIAALASLTAVVMGGTYLVRLAHPAPIAEEPKGPTLPRTQAIPDFLSAVPAAPTPIPPEIPRAAPPPLPASSERPSPPTRIAMDPSAERERAQREALEEQARNAGVFFQTSDTSRRASVAEPSPAAAMPTPVMPTPVMPTGAPSLAPPSLAAGGRVDPLDPNLQDHKSAFLNSTRPSADYLASSLQRPISPYELKAGSIIPITLIDGINSDLPGPVTAQVRERVFDSVTGDHLLVPQGTKLVGWYDSKVAWGQERVLLCWDRIIFPNGKSINLKCMPASDLQGGAGLTDDVDNHYDRLIAAVGLSTILAVGTQAAAGDTTGYQPTLAQTAARNAAGQINNAGQAIVARQINIQPTITVRPGFAANLRVTKDIILEPYAD